MKTIGQIAYEAYCEKLGWKSSSGSPLPQFHELPGYLRVYWEDAAQASITQSAQPPLAEPKQEDKRLSNDKFWAMAFSAYAGRNDVQRSAKIADESLVEFRRRFPKEGV